jgi:hypothetical protein
MNSSKNPEEPMDNVKKLMMGCLTASLIAVGCGVGDGGEWSPYPGPTSGGGVETIVGEELATGTSTTPAPVADRVSMITCEVPPAAEIDLPAGEQVPYYADTRQKVCIGEHEGQAPNLCWEVKAFERRAAAVAACYSAALSELDLQGQRIMGREWRQAALPMLPPVWAKSPEQVSTLSTAISAGMVHLITRGLENSAPGTPLCFPQPKDWSAEQTKNSAVKEIQNLVKGTATGLADVMVALKKGVNLQVNADLRLNVSVLFVERQPNIEEVGACTFHAPTLTK